MKMSKAISNVQCVVCGEARPAAMAVRASSLRPAIAAHLERRSATSWLDGGRVCQRCLQRARHDYLEEQLRSERGDLTALEEEILKRAAAHTAIAEHIEEKFELEQSFGQRLADRVAAVGGSWPFIMTFGGVLIIWIFVNSVVLAGGAFDPYPYILLNLALSCLAAIQAPIILMSQNRSATRDRRQADEDFKINLKAELEIAVLHDKVDHLLHGQWDRMVEMQRDQLELLNQLVGPRGDDGTSE